VYIDNILFIYHDRAYINKTAKAFYRYIKLEELGDISTFLGNNILIDYLSKKIYINQIDYISKLLKKFDIYQYRLIRLPSEAGIRLKKNIYLSDDQLIYHYQ
jgi:hypothetical protein